MNKKAIDWFKRNKTLLVMLAIPTLLLGYFLLPFLLSIIFTILRLAVPILLILIGIKMPWKNTKGKRSGGCEESIEHEKVKRNDEKKNFAETEKGDRSEQVAYNWYYTDGRDRILNLARRMDMKGYCGMTIQNDGLCTVREKGRYVRVGALRNFPENRRYIAKLLKKDGIRNAFVKGKYLLLFWRDK